MRITLITILLCLAPGFASADSSPAVRYLLRFRAPQTHYINVEAWIPVEKRVKIDLMMPIWTPGSYLIREYARHVEGVSATLDGRRVPITKTSKNHWEVETAGGKEVVIKYRVYGHEMSVRTNWIEADFALINGAATFMIPSDSQRRPFDVRFELPRSWSNIATGLRKHPTHQTHRFLARDFDTLVDSPFLIGDLDLQTFRVGGRPHVLATSGHYGRWRGRSVRSDLKKLIKTHQAFWGTIPYDTYSFLNVLGEQGGGLEHMNSAVLMGSRWSLNTPQARQDWLRLASHEFFHTWNVKRMRPAGLGPFDYEAENYTRGLWIAEGITAYFDSLLLRRAGLSKDQDLLKRLSDQIKAVQTTPGRAVRSLEMASQDAWIKYYRPDENSRNTNVSYYSKGAVVAFLLDALIQERTHGTQNLDEVMRVAYGRFAEDGYTPETFEKLASEIARTNLEPWFQKYSAGTDELNFKPALDWYGLRFKPIKIKAGEPKAGWLGVQMKPEENTIRQVTRGGPGSEAGLNVGDEIIAFGKERVPVGELTSRLKFYPPNTKVDVLIARRGRIMRIPVTLTQPPRDEWTLEIDPKATKKQKSRLRVWLDGRKQS